MDIKIYRLGFDMIQKVWYVKNKFWNLIIWCNIYMYRSTSKALKRTSRHYFLNVNFQQLFNSLGSLLCHLYLCVDSTTTSLFTDFKNYITLHIRDDYKRRCWWNICLLKIIIYHHKSNIKPLLLVKPILL